MLGTTIIWALWLSNSHATRRRSLAEANPAEVKTTVSASVRCTASSTSLT